MTILIELLPSAGPVLIVGAGRVALRRATQFVAAGFAVEVVAPTLDPGFANLPAAVVTQREFQDQDIPGRAVVCACTDVREVNARVGELARQLGIPAVVADRHEESTFFMPAMHRDGSLVVGVGTGGASPLLAAEVRDRLAACLGDGWALRVEESRQARQQTLGRGERP
ncbi:MAG: bifunctional precorrin-2 dehydrogenase/sirohydrochlorin ferrochelatase [Dehalococcoidia bacterium]